MIKDTAGQVIGAQLVSATDGSAFTGAVTMYVTGDGGTQAIGSVLAGLCTHEGNGYHTYTPARAETNYDFIGFTFIGSGAVPVTVDVYTVVGPVSSTTPPVVPTGATTIADVFDVMGLLDNELDLASGGDDEDRAILAVKVAQRYFETLAATMPAGTLQTIVDTLTTTASTETTTWPATLKRLDAVWKLDPTSLRPVYRLKRIHEIGGHVPSLPWPLQLSLNTGSGSPAGYYANTTSFYWLPLPDGTHTLRIYGFVTGAVPVDRTSAFAYPDTCLAPFAAFAVRLMAAGVGDESSDLTALAETCFRPLLRGMRKFDRSEAIPRSYAYAHDT